jgi:multisubunit Na+/H+ antiporter MnhB subunit
LLITTARALLPLFLIFSLFLLWRGHNEPGGGFVGGLVAASGLVLYGLAHGPAAVRRLVRANLKTVIGVGLGAALLSALIPIVSGRPFMSGVWIAPFGIKLGTPTLFDVGVYIVVFGIALTILLSLAEE